MKQKYQKLYDNLNGKEFSSKVSKYSSALDSVGTYISNVESLVNSSVWEEQGLNIIKNSVLPALTKQKQSLQEGISALSNASSKISTLVSKLNDLKTACSNYDNCDEDDKDGKDKYSKEVSKLETEIDGIVSEINGISFDYSDSKNDISAYITTIKESITTKQTEQKQQTQVNTHSNKYSQFTGKKAEFIGTINDDSYYLDPIYTDSRTNHAKQLYAYDNTTGEIIGEGGKIYLKPGETRVLTVKLPTDAGHIKQVVRTTADNLGSSVVSTRSDIDPDPNSVQYVNYKYNHYPNDSSLLYTNYFDWIITANEEGVVQISQTCEYKIQENNSTPKAMMDIVVVVDKNA